MWGLGPSQGAQEGSQELDRQWTPGRTSEGTPHKRRPGFAYGAPLCGRILTLLPSLAPQPMVGQGGTPHERTLTPGGSRTQPLCSLAGFLSLEIIRVDLQKAEPGSATAPNGIQGCPLHTAFRISEHEALIFLQKEAEVAGICITEAAMCN